MKILVLSDLHLEFYYADPLYEKIPDVDVVVFAGDIHVRPKNVGEYFRKFRQRTEAKIIYVLGNHEYYHGYFPRDMVKYQHCIEGIKDFYLLERNTITIDNFTFAGVTLWTDYNKGADDAVAMINMNDHHVINLKGEEKVMPCDFRKTYGTSVKFLKREMKKHGENLVVITHHAPSWNSIAKKFIGSPLNSSFCSDLSEMILEYQPKLWVHGHVHDKCDYLIGETRVACNPLGYPSETLNGEFNYLVIEI